MDNNLIRQAKNRDPDAFSELIRSHIQHLYKTARAILSRDEDAADAISETILTCWEKLEQLHSEQHFRTWMTRILINKCNDILRKQVPLRFTQELPETPVRERGYENLEWNDTLNCLDEKYRLVLMLYYVEGFKTTEIGQILDIPESTVRTRLARGREKLAKQFDVKSPGRTLI